MIKISIKKIKRMIINYEKYNSNIKLGTATLNVVNFERQLKFYTEAMGML